MDTGFWAGQNYPLLGFSPTFTIQRQAYHRLGSLPRALNEKLHFLQVYFEEDENA